MDLYDSEGNITDEGDYFDDDIDDFYEPRNKMIKILKEEGLEMQYLSEFPSPYGRYVAIDAEFTGLDEKEDQLLELAAYEVKNCELTGKKFHAYIKPRGEIKGTQFHGITKETYEKLPDGIILDDKKNLENFLKFVGDSLIFAHNPTKDMIFINKELSLCGLKEIGKYQYRCTMRMYYKKYSHTHLYKINLETCCKTFHIVGLDKHKALNDAENTAKLLIYLIRKKGKKNSKKRAKKK